MKLLLSQRILCTPYNHTPCQSHICRVLQHVCLAVTCHLHFWQNDQDLSCYCNTMGDTEIRVSTERWPWRRKLSCHSCPDPNLQPFNRESSALITELSLLPIFVPYTLMLQSFPCSVLFIRHMHAQTPMLQPLNPCFCTFSDFSPNLDQSPLSHQPIYDGGKAPPPNSELLTNMAFALLLLNVHGGEMAY